MANRLFRKIAALLCIGICVFSTGCANETSEHIESTESAEKTDAILVSSYESKVISLGNYKNLSYHYDGNRQPTDEEVDAEMEAILYWFEDGKLTEEFVQERLGYDSIEAFRGETIANLRAVYQENAHKAAGMELMNQVIETSEFELSEKDIERQYEDYMQLHRLQAEAGDMELEEYAVTWMEMSLEELEAYSREAAERVVCVGLLSEAIAEAEKLDVEAAYEQIGNRLVAKHGFDTIEELENELGGREALLEEIRYELVVDYMMENGKRM